MSGLVRIFFACCFSFAFCATTGAENYKYRDDSGRLNFVDDKDKIPTRFRGDSTTLPESGKALGVYNSIYADEPVEISTIESPRQPEESRKRKKSKYQTSVVIKGNRILVPAEVTMGNRSAELTLLLDTGATATVFHRSALTGLELPKGRIYKARVAGGGIVKSRKMLFRKFSIGPYEIEDQKAMVINLNGRDVPFDGMLGMDFLKSHPYQIDYDEQRLTWERVE